MPSPSNLGVVDLWGLAITMVETLPRGSTFQSGFSTRNWWDINFQVDRLACSKTYATGQWLQQGGHNGFVTPIQTYGVDDMGPAMRSLWTSSWLICAQGIASALL